MLDSSQVETKVHNHQTGETISGTIGAIVLTDIAPSLRDEWEPQFANYVSFDFWTDAGEDEHDVSTFILTPDQARKLAVELMSKVNRLKVIR
tara:strand:+ start:381 stop:656 length:276 start_codon:yes stop_codon:yes gene_type:complete